VVEGVSLAQNFPRPVRRGRRPGLFPGLLERLRAKVQAGAAVLAAMARVFKKDLRLFLRDRSALLFSVLMPNPVITVIAEALFHDDSGRVLVPVVKRGRRPGANTFTKLLASTRRSAREPGGGGAPRAATRRRAAAIVFPPG